MRHLADPVGGGLLAGADAVGESGAATCGDVVRIQLAVSRGRVREARFLAFGCGATLASASAACESLTGASVRAGLRLSGAGLDRALGGLDEDRRHGPELVEDAVARTFEAWFSERLGQVGIPLSADRVAVAMSGGVDSAVAAMLLRDAGKEVIGVTMRLWHDPAAAAAQRSCCSPETVRLARASAHALGIPHLTIDAVERFRRGVVEDFIEGYRAGVTPNPCVTCNGEVRFQVLREAAALLGARWLATGHYARIARGSDGRATVARAAAGAKDQSYMLARLDRAFRDRLIFPLGDLTKDRVRAAARAAGLPAADAVESQEVCFVGEGGYRPFLERNAGLVPRKGPIVDRAGRRLGTHGGYWRYTVGQRRGLSVASPEPLFVLGTDASTNTVTVGPKGELTVPSIVLRPSTLHEPIDDEPLEVRLRYRGAPARGRARPLGEDALRVDLLNPVDAVAPGQTAALYRDGRLVAAGTIAPPVHEPVGG